MQKKKFPAEAYEIQGDTVSDPFRMDNEEKIKLIQSIAGNSKSIEVKLYLTLS